MSKLVSILLNTIDRYDLTVKCIGGAMANKDYDNTEFMWCDNGSNDRRVIDYIISHNPAWYETYMDNKGCAVPHNKMLRVARGDYFCLLDNDIELPGGWLRAMVDAADTIEQSGTVGIYTEGLSPELHELVYIDNVPIHAALPPKEDAVFGTRLFSRKVLDKVGYFCEDYGVYGLVDNEYNTRVHHSGFLNYYISNMRAVHLGGDVGENSTYRRMKDESLRIAAPIMAANMKRYFETGDFYVPYKH